MFEGGTVCCTNEGAMEGGVKAGNEKEDDEKAIGTEDAGAMDGENRERGGVKSLRGCRVDTGESMAGVDDGAVEKKREVRGGVWKSSGGFA